MHRITFRRIAYLIVLISFLRWHLCLSEPTLQSKDSILPIPCNDDDSTKGFKSLLSSINRDLDSEERFELNSNVVSFVNNYLDKESYDFEKLKERAKPYFLIYDQILSDNGLPVELKYLSVIESGLQRNLGSGKGAVGPWQLMPNEAKRFGLKITSKYDERTNFQKKYSGCCENT